MQFKTIWMHLSSISILNSMELLSEARKREREKWEKKQHLTAANEKLKDIVSQLFWIEFTV